MESAALSIGDPLGFLSLLICSSVREGGLQLTDIGERKRDRPDQVRGRTTIPTPETDHPTISFRNDNCGSITTLGKIFLDTWGGSNENMVPNPSFRLLRGYRGRLLSTVLGTVCA